MSPTIPPNVAVLRIPLKSETALVRATRAFCVSVSLLSSFDTPVTPKTPRDPKVGSENGFISADSKFSICASFSLKFDCGLRTT